MYRYKDERTGRRLAVYSPDLAELRKKEKEIEKDQSGEYTGQLQKDVEQSCEERTRTDESGTGKTISCTLVLFPAEQTEIFPQYHQVSP